MKLCSEKNITEKILNKKRRKIDQKIITKKRSKIALELCSVQSIAYLLMFKRFCVYKSFLGQIKVEMNINVLLYE